MWYPQLKPNDHIRILCTARSVQPDELIPASNWLTSLHLRVSYGDTIGAVHHQMGGDITMRRNDLQLAIDDPDVQAIWVARGGYGTIQIIDGIDFSRLTTDQPKLIMGYSDVTVLHSHLSTLGIPSLHTFMPLEFKTQSNQSLQHLSQSLCGKQQSIIIPNTDQLSNQSITGTLIGGNLSILYSLLGSASFPDTKARVLFIEDIDEYLYHIERMLYALQRAGHLDHLAAIVVGGMTAMRDHQIPFGYSVYQIVKSITRAYDYPVVFNYPAGHVQQHFSLKLGQPMTIDINQQHIHLYN